MRLLIEEFGWDGEYYIAAINDDGVRLGTHKAEYGKMWLNPNTWAVLAGVADEDKLRGIMDKVDENLECEYGTRLNYPPCGEFVPTMGNYPIQPKGTLLNASVYLQPNAWKMWAEAILKKPHKVQESLEKILPWNNKWSETQGEPYILYNYYSTADTGYRKGIPGQSWRTATHACVVKGIIRYIFGFAPDENGLKLDACLPPDWKECSMSKKYRRCTYDIRYHQTGEKKILVDGKVYEGEYLPHIDGGNIVVDYYF